MRITRRLWDAWRWGVISALLALLAGSGMIALNARIEYDRLLAKEKIESAEFSDRFTHRVEDTMQPAVSATSQIALVAQTSQTTFTSPSDQAALNEIQASTPGWRSLSVAPSNCISAVAPKAGNESAIGYCLTANQDEWRAIQGLIANKKPGLIGPVALAQGKTAFIYDRPVFAFDGTYWGIASALIDTEIFTASLNEFAASSGRVITMNVESISQSGNVQLITNAFPQGMSVTRSNWTYAGDVYSLASAPKEIDMTTIELIQRRGGAFTLLVALLAGVIVGVIQKQLRTRRKLEAITSTAPSVLFQISVRKNDRVDILFVGENCKYILGISSKELLADTSGLIRGMDERDRKIAQDRLNSAQSPGEIWSQRLGFTRPNGDHLWLQADATYKPQGRNAGIWNGVLVDATEAAMHEESLAVTSSVFAAMSEGVAILDGDFRVLEINQGLTDLTGYTISDVRGRSFREFGTGNTSNATYDAIERSLTNFGSWRGQVTNIHAGGRLSQDLLNISTSTDSSGDIRRIIVVLTPSERLLIDSVTQLANRPLFEDQLTRAFESLNTFEQKLVLVHVGVEGIGAVNDSFGHLAGDTVLRELASRLALFSVSPESIGRIADTEFALYRTGDDVVGNTDSWTQAILDSISEPFHFEDVQILLKASAGISISPDDSLNAAEIRTHADQAYKASLAPNGSQISYFSQQMENRAKVRSYLTSDLRDALRREELQFYFQPIIRLSDGAVVKAEALSRWIDPQLGEISPSRFIPLAETSNLIHELGSQLFSACISMIAELEAIGNPLQISINLSPAEIMSPAFARETELRAAIAQGVDPGSMTFELTEGVLLERPDVVMARISSMRALGVQFAIDDFGTGYSSLSYLQRLSVDYVKIDKTFVDDIETEEGLSLCRSIIDLAHALKLQVIAEGVESHAQMVILTNLGCDLAQGYLFSKPLPRDSFINFLSTARALTL